MNKTIEQEMLFSSLSLMPLLLKTPMGTQVFYSLGSLIGERKLPARSGGLPHYHGVLDSGGIPTLTPPQAGRASHHGTGLSDTLDEDRYGDNADRPCASCACLVTICLPDPRTMCAWNKATKC
jgi:hypothetical protein